MWRVTPQGSRSCCHTSRLSSDASVGRAEGEGVGVGGGGAEGINATWRTKIKVTAAFEEKTC